MWDVYFFIYSHSIIFIYIYYFTIKENVILLFATVWTSLEDIILSEMSQTEKDKYCTISLTCAIWKSGTWRVIMLNKISQTEKDKYCMISCMHVCSVASVMFNFLWPMDCGLPGISVDGIFQERILEQVAMCSSNRSSQPRDRTHFSWIQADSVPLNHQRSLISPILRM